MDTIAQTNEKLVLEDKPVLGKLMSYLLVGAGVILILPNPYKPNPDYLMYIGIVMFFGGFVLMRFLRPAVTCTFDKGNGKLTIARIRHFRSSEQDTYPLGEIDKIRIESHQERTGTRYRLSLRMPQQKWVPLTEQFTQADSHTLESIAKKIQAFL